MYKRWRLKYQREYKFFNREILYTFIFKTVHKAKFKVQFRFVILD